MKKAIVIKPSGETTEVEPANGTDFTLDECYALCGCDMIQVIPTDDGRIMILDETGKFKADSKLNLQATAIVTLYRGDEIVGTVLVCDPSQLQ